jgi:hypothetical protein
MLEHDVIIISHLSQSRPLFGAWLLGCSNGGARLDELACGARHSSPSLIASSDVSSLKFAIVKGGYSIGSMSLYIGERLRQLVCAQIGG